MVFFLGGCSCSAVGTVEFWAFLGRRPPRCHHVREGGLLAVHQGWPLGRCFCAASGLLFRVELCAFLFLKSFVLTLLAWPRVYWPCCFLLSPLFADSKARLLGLVLSLLPLPCCLGVSGWNSELPLPCCFSVLGWSSGVFKRGRAARCPSAVAPGLFFLCCLWAIVRGGIMCFFSFLADPAGLASFGCPHCSLAVLTLLSLPFCLSV